MLESFLFMRRLLLCEANPEIERAFHLRRMKQKIIEQIREVRRTSTNMAGGGGDQRRTLRDFVVPRVQGIASSIAPPHVDANNFELQPALISMLQQYQFRGAPLEDPNLHLLIFFEVCETLKLSGVSTDAIRLRLFRFSLRYKARAYIHSLPSGCITMWEAY